MIVKFVVLAVRNLISVKFDKSYDLVWQGEVSSLIWTFSLKKVFFLPSIEVPLLSFIAYTENNASGVGGGWTEGEAE